MTAFFSSFWRFNGRLARRAYALRFITFTAIYAALLTLGTHVFGLNLKTSGVLPFVEPIPGAVLAFLFYWVSTALSAQRLRDMGFPVLPIIAALIAFDGFENFFLRPLTEARLPAPLDMMTPLGGVLSIVTSLWLLLWPSATAQAPSSAPPDPFRRSDAAPQPPA